MDLHIAPAAADASQEGQASTGATIAIGPEPDVDLHVDLDAARFGRLIRRRRMAQAISQMELARVVGTSQNMIFRLERSAADPPLSVALRLVRWLQIDPAVLVYGQKRAGTLRRRKSA